MLKERYQ